MSPLLAQFQAEASEVLEGIALKLMQLEKQPGDPSLMNELFRLVHTLKGNSGLFDFPEMTKVLHAAEDLMDSVRTGATSQSQNFTDQILDAMDFVGELCREIEAHGAYAPNHTAKSAQLAQALRALISTDDEADSNATPANSEADSLANPIPAELAHVPRAVLDAARLQVAEGAPCFWLTYKPDEACFFQGDDPLFRVRQTPGHLWGKIVPTAPWPDLSALDPFHCALAFHSIALAPLEELAEHFQYMPDQVEFLALSEAWLAHPEGQSITPQPGLELYSTSQVQTEGLSLENSQYLAQLFHSQRQILNLAGDADTQRKRFQAVADVLSKCCQSLGDTRAQSRVVEACDEALSSGSAAPLLAWLNDANAIVVPKAGEAPTPGVVESSPSETSPLKAQDRSEEPSIVTATTASGPAKSLKVDQAKIDRLMNLIGELVVSKNAIPYLAQRAENQFGVRELSREIKTQYSVINRIAEEMQDAIMQIRMLPVSFIFQRFPRLVRDISRKLGKEVSLVLVGEDTEADKNIIESLADPLIHIIRNSLDHGLETPEVRKAQGKAASGTLTISATQEADRVLIEITDDGKGINPEVIKRKAYEKGLVDEEALARLTDLDAIQLIFAAGFSTAETVSDLSGRGVGMDVVRSAVERVNGTIQLESEVGKGTRLRISLPLSMAVTQVMIVESDSQIFGIPMDHVVETVRIPRAAIRTIKHSPTTILRGRVVPLKSLNGLLQIAAAPKANEQDELAVLVVRLGTGVVGLIVDDFCETVDVIQKPLLGILSGLNVYSGSALMGDGSVLMVLNLKEVI